MSEMLEPDDSQKSEELPGRRRRVILAELRKRTVWFIRLRWCVPPSIAMATVLAWLLGVEFDARGVLSVAAAILVYNLLLALASRRFSTIIQAPDDFTRRFTYWQVALDYAAMFMLIHLTGGAASPLLFFFLFHIIFASILLPPRSAYGFAFIASAGVVLFALVGFLQLIPQHPPSFHGNSIDLGGGGPFQLAAVLLSFTASVFLTAFLTTAIARVLRGRIVGMAEALEEISALNDKLRALYTIAEAVGAKQRLEPVVSIAKQGLARVMGVHGVSVKLLSDDGDELRFAAVHGLPESLLRYRIKLAESPLNHKIVAGEPYAAGDLTDQEQYEIREELDRAGIRSVLFVPLGADSRVIGILGAYCRHPNRFGEDDIEFLRLAAGLLAIAIENAQAYEAVQRLMQDRSRFMWRVAHNLRAPLAAALSILDVVRGGYLGELTPSQAEYIRRVDRRGRTMASMINELLALAKCRTEKREIDRDLLDFGYLASRLRRSFKDEAARKSLGFEVHAASNLPSVSGDVDAIEQMLENLVSNAIKYTPHGHVRIGFTRGDAGGVQIEVVDTGIGVPREDRDRLFTEFFRAENARAIEEVGTGLGLALVKETVDRHGGRMEIESTEGKGTRFTVALPGASEASA